MTKIFKGRPVLIGNVEGKAVVSHVGFNTCASYLGLVFGGEKSGVCMDHDNKDLYLKDLKDTILCIPQSIGSTTAPTMFVALCEYDIAPKVILFANHIDSLAATGLLMGDTWVNHRIVTIDMLGQEFLDTVKTGDTLKVYEDGTVEIQD